MVEDDWGKPSVKRSEKADIRMIESVSVQQYCKVIPLPTIDYKGESIDAFSGGRG